MGSTSALSCDTCILKLFATPVGLVRERPADMRNSEMASGHIELQIQSLELLNMAKPLPMDMHSILANTSPPGEVSSLPSDQVRLRNRHLDLRQPYLQRNIRLRSKVAHIVRSHLIQDHQFVEVETPTLFKATAEVWYRFPTGTFICSLSHAVSHSCVREQESFWFQVVHNLENSTLFLKAHNSTRNYRWHQALSDIFKSLSASVTSWVVPIGNLSLHR